MAKFKPAGSRKRPVSGPTPGAVSCITLIILGFLALGAILYFSMPKG